MKDTCITLRDIENLTLTDIEEYGSDIQLSISDQMSKMLKDTKCISLDKTGKCLSDLSVESNSITKKLVGVEKLPSFLKVSKWLSKYDNIENRINVLEDGIMQEKQRLNTVLNGMYDNLQFMKEQLTKIEDCELQLKKIVDYYENADSDELKVQAAVNRLKIITTTKAVVKQECAKTVLIIKENKEVTSQLSEAIDNLVPILKVSMLNVLGAKTNEEALKLKKSIAKLANDTIIENARQIERTAEQLIDGRQAGLIEVKTIQDANNILQSALIKVQKSALTEIDTNKDAIKQLESSIKQVDLLGTRIAERQDS